LNLQPLDYKSNTLPLHYRATQADKPIGDVDLIPLYAVVPPGDKPQFKVEFGELEGKSEIADNIW